MVSVLVLGGTGDIGSGIVRPFVVSAMIGSWWGTLTTRRRWLW